MFLHFKQGSLHHLTVSIYFYFLKNKFFLTQAYISVLILVLVQELSYFVLTFLQQLMNETKLIGFQVWDLKRALLTYYLCFKIPRYDSQRWIQYYISSRSTEALEKDLDSVIKRQLNLIVESQKFKFLNSIFEAERTSGNEGNQVMKNQLLREILSITISKQSNRCQNIVELLMRNQKQEALDKVNDLPLEGSTRKSLAKLIKQKSPLISTSPKHPNYDMKEIVHKMSLFITEETSQLFVPNKDIIKSAIEDIYQLLDRPKLESLVQELQNSDNEENKEILKLELLLKLVLKINDTIAHFSQQDVCRVEYNQQNHTFAKGYRQDLVLQDLGIKQQAHHSYMFIRKQEPLASLNSQCLTQNCQLIQCRQFQLLFEEEKIAMALPPNLPLKKCKSLIWQKLQIKNNIDIELKGKSTSLQEKCLKDFINPTKEIDIFEIIEMQLKIIASQRSTLVKQRGDFAIRQLKERYEAQIGIQWQKQNWSYFGREVDKQILYELKSDYFMKFEITTKATYEFYGFTSPLTISFEAFKSFSFENDQYFLKKIQEEESIKFADPQYEPIFRELCLAYFFSSIKKHSLLSNSIAHIKKMVSQLPGERAKIKLWKPVQFKGSTINKFNDTYLIYHLIASAQNKLKVQLLRQLKNNYPVPLLMQERGIPQWLYEDHYWIHGKAFNVASLSFPGDHNKGKSSLLNYIFNANFQHRQKLHNDCCGNIEICFNVLQSEDQIINIIDISDKVEQTLQIELIKACNLVMIHAQDQSALKMKEIQSWLAQHQVNIPYIVLFRDASFEDYQNFKPISQPIDNPQLKTRYLHYSIVELTPLSMENYLLIFQQIGSAIHQFIKNQFEFANEDLWKFTDFLSKKSSPKLQQLNCILKEVDLGKQSFSTIINLQQQLYSQLWSNQTQYQEGVRSQVLQSGLTFLMKSVIGYCKENVEYLGEIFKKLKDFLLLKKNELCKDLYDVDHFRFSHSKEDETAIQRKLDIIEEKIISSKFVIISANAKQRFRNQLKKLSQSGLNLEKLQPLKTYFFQQIYPKIFSIELFWRELISMYKINRSYTFEVNGVTIKLEEELLLFGNKLIIESEAFELINGDLLDLPKDFLKKVFQGFEEKGVMVIGIVGPQSSGKSTLLNFVLGCDFMSSVGRCTKGVYGTYYQISNKDEINFTSILILDSEGLMSNYENPRHANRNNFDLKILLFCIKICDIVIFNNRGDYTRECKPLLELTFDPELASSQVLPDFYFVINMNVGQNMQKQRSQFQSFCESIKITSHLAQQCLKTDNIISLPIAFNQNQPSIFSNDSIPMKKTPKTQYINETVRLNKIIYKMLAERSSRDDYKMRNLGTLITQINQRWHTLNNYPLLTKFIDRQIKKIGCSIQERETSVDERLVQYLLQQKKNFEELSQNWLLDQNQTFNLQNVKQQYISKYEKVVEEKILQFDNEFLHESSSVQMKTDMRKFILNKRQQVKQCFLLKKKIIEEYFKQFQLKTAIESAERKKSAQLQKLIAFCVAEVKKNSIGEENLKEYFHQFWIQQNKIKLGMNIDRQVIANDIYERCSKIYKKFLNKQFETKQKYQITQYKLPCTLSLHDYQAEISAIFKSKFTSQDKIFEYNHKQPVFSVGQNQNGLIRSKLQYFKMRDFYTTQEGYKLIQFNFKNLSHALKRQSLMINVNNQIMLDNRISQQFSIRLVADLFTLGIDVALSNIRQYITSQIINYLWESQDQQEASLLLEKKNMMSRDQTNKFSFFKIFENPSTKRNYKPVLCQLNTQKSLFQYNLQYLLLTAQQIQGMKMINNKNETKREEFFTFRMFRKQFFSKMTVLTMQFCEANITEIQNRRNKFNDIKEVKGIIKVFIKNYIKNIARYNKSLFEYIKQLKESINEDLIDKLNQNLSVINLRILRSSGLLKEIIITKLHEFPIKFESDDHLKKTIARLGEYWYPLKNSYTVIDKQRQEQSHCKIRVNEIRVKDSFLNDRCLEKYKSKEIEYFKCNSNKRNFLALAFQYIKQYKIFEKIMENIGRKIVEIAEETQLNIVEKIEGIIKEVNIVLKDFNNDLRQICQKVIYDFQIQLHSWAFHYFWKLREQLRWNYIKSLIEISKLEVDEEKEFLQFQAKLSKNPEIVNDKYAQQCLNRYNNYILTITKSCETQLMRMMISRYNTKVRSEMPAAKVDQIIINDLVKKIDQQQALTQDQQKRLTLDVDQYLTVKRKAINRYYEQSVKSQIVEKYEADLKVIIENGRKYYQEMRICLQSTLPIDPKHTDATILFQMLLGTQKPKCQLKWLANKEFVRVFYKQIQFTDIELFVTILIRKLNEILDNFELLDIGISRRKFSKFCKADLCQERCPCCFNICIQQNPRHKQHRCFGHHYRAVAGVSVEANDSKRIPSYFRCDEVGNDDILEYDGKSMSWENFKKDNQEWSFQGNNPDYWVDSLRKLWSVAGKRICERFKFDYIPFQQGKIYNGMNMEVEYIFALDESGSMDRSKWKNLIDAVGGQLQDIKKDFNQSLVSVLTFNHMVTPVYTSQPPSSIRIDNIKNKGGATNYASVFRKIYDLARRIHRKSIVVIFITDGIAGFPTREVEQLRFLKEQLNLQRLEFIFITLFISDEQNTMETETLQRIKDGLGGRFVDVKDIRNLKSRLKEVQKSISAIFSNRTSFEGLR